MLIVFARAHRIQHVLAGLQRDIPGYTTALQGSAKIRKQLNALTGTRAHLTDQLQLDAPPRW